MTRFYTDWRRELTETPFDTLAVEGRIDYIARQSPPADYGSPWRFAGALP